MVELRDGEERDDTSHGSVLAQLAEASDDDLEEIDVDPDDIPDPDDEPDNNGGDRDD